jgi:hypothetical protein
MAIKDRPVRAEMQSGTATDRWMALSRYLPGWARFILALWLVCLLLLGFQQLSLLLFTISSGGRG